MMLSNEKFLLIILSIETIWFISIVKASWLSVQFLKSRLLETMNATPVRRGPCYQRCIYTPPRRDIGIVPNLGIKPNLGHWR